MKKILGGKPKADMLLMTILIWILVFQNALERIWAPFSYIDELVAMIGCIWGVYRIAVVQRCRATKEQLLIIIPLLAFAAIGLTGNLLYKYQPMKSVIIDLYTNLKFFFAIGTGYFLFENSDWDELKKAAVLSARSITIILFAAFLADRIFAIWPSEIRHGISSAVLFFQHPSYLAGAVAFLLVILTAFYEKRNIPFIVAAIIIMVFTMRGKALASAAVYVIVFVAFGIFKWKLKLWHILVGAAAFIAIAWPQIQFYFIDLAGHSARSVMLITSFAIMKDYFPIGTGFGTYASAEAAKNYSPVYLKYEFNNYFELRDINDVENSLRLIAENRWYTEQYLLDPNFVNSSPFLSDSFWPIIFGQTGVLGTIFYVFLLGVVFAFCLKTEKLDRHIYAGIIFSFAYLLIASAAEPAFNNSIAIPLALVIGVVFTRLNKENA